MADKGWDEIDMYSIGCIRAATSARENRDKGAITKRGMCHGSES